MNKLVVFALVATAGSAQAFSFDDLVFWVGSGEKRAALVIDWKSGPEPRSLAWGFRFTGNATGLTMLEAVRDADPRLYVEWVPGLEREAVFGLGYDRNGNGFSKADPEDSYREGWFENGFWAYYVDSTPGPNLPDPWDLAPSGLASRTLVDGSWDGWSWAQDFVPSPPDPPTAVPEPATLVALVGGLLALARRRR